jgi:hypothetical protein
VADIVDVRIEVGIDVGIDVITADVVIASPDIHGCSKCGTSLARNAKAALLARLVNGTTRLS